MGQKMLAVLIVGLLVAADDVKTHPVQMLEIALFVSGTALPQDLQEGSQTFGLGNAPSATRGPGS